MDATGKKSSWENYREKIQFTANLPIFPALVYNFFHGAPFPVNRAFLRWNVIKLTDMLLLLDFFPKSYNLVN